MAHLDTKEPASNPTQTGLEDPHLYAHQYTRHPAAQIMQPCASSWIINYIQILTTGWKLENWNVSYLFPFIFLELCLDFWNLVWFLKYKAGFFHVFCFKNCDLLFCGEWYVGVLCPSGPLYYKETNENYLLHPDGTFWGLPLIYLEVSAQSILKRKKLAAFCHKHI